ncbi:MAG TPA: hypothetical protein VM782_01340, partial [Stellaceae bacterium]|nr:hypothetical protein [Stellaceae bacterium]
GMPEDGLEWFGVRCVFAWSGWDGRPFEERITLWRARSLSHAVELAEQEASGYAKMNGLERLSLNPPIDLV